MTRTCQPPSQRVGRVTCSVAPDNLMSVDTEHAVSDRRTDSPATARCFGPPGPGSANTHLATTPLARQTPLEGDPFCLWHVSPTSRRVAADLIDVRGRGHRRRTGPCQAKAHPDGLGISTDRDSKSLAFHLKPQLGVGRIERLAVAYDRSALRAHVLPHGRSRQGTHRFSLKSSATAARDVGRPLTQVWSVRLMDTCCT